VETEQLQWWDSENVNYHTVNMSAADEDERGLSDIQCAQNTRLFRAYLRHGGPLPDDWERLCGWAKVHGKWATKALKELLEKRWERVFVEHEGEYVCYWRLPSAEKELARIAKKMRLAKRPSRLVEWDLRCPTAPEQCISSESTVHQTVIKVESGVNQVRIRCESAGDGLLEKQTPSPDSERDRDRDNKRDRDSEGSPVAVSMATATVPNVSAIERSEPECSVPSTPWGPGTRWANYAEWRADPTTGVAPTEEQKQKAADAALRQRIRSGEFFH
jgi:hypothetical protein